jgi:hypothetical protein
MTTREIMELLLKDKKLRSTGWGEEEYVCLDEEGNLIDEKGNLHSLHLLSCIDNLKEYIEYVDFNTALDHMINGGKAKRKNCIGYFFSNDSVPLVLYKDDILAKDWILL